MSDEMSQQWTQPQQRQQQQSYRNRQRTVLSIEAALPSPEAMEQLQRQLHPTQPGLKEISFRREGRSSKVRISATAEALPQIQSVLQNVVQTVQQAYAGAGTSSYGSSQQPF